MQQHVSGLQLLPMLMNMFATVTVYTLQLGKKFESSCVAGTMHSVQIKGGVPISGIVLYSFPRGWDCVYRRCLLMEVPLYNVVIHFLP